MPPTDPERDQATGPRQHSRGWAGRPGFVGLCLVALLLPACGGQEDPAAGDTGLSRAQFIDAVVALRAVEMDLQLTLDDDSVMAEQFEVLRDSILEAQDVTPEQLQAFIDRHEDLAYQDALWDTITKLLRRARDYEPDPKPLRLEDRRPIPSPGRPVPGEDELVREKPIRR